MNENQKTALIAWLRDAHAMELGLVDSLEQQIKEIEGDTPMKIRLQEHLAETQNHAALVKGCLARYNTESSPAKNWGSKMGAALSEFGMNMTEDAKVKAVLGSYSAEHFEIAVYISIKSAALSLGDFETASVCDEIMDDEEDMADWLLEQIPKVASNYIQGL